MEIVPFIAECLGVPLIRREIAGDALSRKMYYKEHPGDEVEDLFQLLQEVKKAHPEVQAVASGAVLSNYQRLRVENCCQRLGLLSLAYLWKRD